MATWERYGSGAILIADYDPWPAMYEQERARLLDVLGSMAIAIEHVGSTAVPGLTAKPIIDLLVGVQSLAQARLHCIQPLERLGYTYLPEYESWLPGELLFGKGMSGPWTHHVHVAEPASIRWEELILIRDYLRRHPEVAADYAALKKVLALEFGEDIAGYREAKRSFLREVMARARAE